ncbi:MAG: FIST C-terminal domain-containing protein [Alphaproteobacteria bacterium]|nr:FIST C-terminal domain-containing protein [Alphaproteobacteria bacterium]
MNVEEKHLIASEKFSIHDSHLQEKANLVIYFGGKKAFEDAPVYQTLRRTYPNSILVGCSTGGEIAGNDIHENSVISLAIDFEKTTVKSSSYTIHLSSESFNIGQKIGSDLLGDDLKGIFILSDGLHANGSALVDGVLSKVGKHIPLMGGLAGDGSNFKKTLVGIDKIPCEKQIVAIGFYGDAIRFGHGSEGGWEPFGLERKITKSHGNVLYELDGKPALDIYKSYLGKRADDLPASALLFPLAVSHPDTPDVSMIRTILSVDEELKTMTFTGDIPENYSARLMHSTVGHLIEGARSAGEAAQSGVNSTKDSVGILISCIGRKLAMGSRVIDEVDAVWNSFGEAPCFKAGFFSYGEISPGTYSGVSELQNQTMTVMTFTEDC